MTMQALRAIVLHELNLIEEDLSADERIIVAIEIAIRLLSVELQPAQKPD